MSDKWVTADSHHGHFNIIKHCNRPFTSAKEMDEALIDNWNSVVKPNDIVYHLGDFCFKGGFKPNFYTSKLNGNIILIKGNHDGKINEKYGSTEDGFFQIENGIYEIKPHNNVHIVLCHYAMRTWNHSHHGALHCYGHSHGNLPGYMRSMDVGVDTNNFFPYNLEDVIERLQAIEIPKLEDR